MGETSIEWTDATWNPVRGCSRVSAGCENCYAERVAARFSGPGLAYEGLARIGKNGARWTGDVRLVREHLEDPLRWRRSRRIFVNSMSDLFHERIRDDEIATVFSVMESCQQHTFQILTKRPARMQRWVKEWQRKIDYMADHPAPAGGLYMQRYSHVWLGVSIEDQATADERIPLLWDTHASLRFVSYEPALGPVDIAPWLLNGSVDWVIVGGESGHGARPCAVEWLESMVEQCRAAKVPVFVKQLGANVVSTFRVDETGAWAWRAGLKSRKGGDMDEWPPALQVREFPTPRTA